MAQYLPIVAFVAFIGSLAWMCWRMNVSLRRFEREADRLRQQWDEEEALLEPRAPEGAQS